jgi:hypothetical protein
VVQRRAAYLVAALSWAQATADDGDHTRFRDCPSRHLME